MDHVSSIGDGFVSHLELIGTLTSGEKEALRSLSGEQRSFARGQNIQRSGMRPSSLVIVLSGTLARCATDLQGNRQIHELYLPTDTPSLETLYIGVTDNSLEALCESSVGLVPHAVLQELMRGCPSLVPHLWRETQVQAAMFRQWLTRNSKMSGVERMAHFLCEMFYRSAVIGAVSDCSCPLHITQSDISDCLGLSMVHVNRVLQSLRARRLADHKHGVLRIFDFDRLAQIAGFEPEFLHILNPPPCAVLRTVRNRQPRPEPAGTIRCLN